jgi:hypothetical protein
LAVLTAQKPQARVQRSPAIMNVAVPLLQHSQWFGHLALSQTVCSFSSSSRLRVRVKLSDVGSWKRSQSGRRGRGFNSVVVTNLFYHGWTRIGTDKTGARLCLKDQPQRVADRKS